MSQAVSRTAPAAAPLSSWIAIFVGIFAVSSSAVLARLAQGEGVPSLIIAAFRLIAATVVLTPFVLPRYRAEIRKLSRKDWILLIAAGVFLAIHFSTWISSLEFTSVLISTVLVTTTPLWVSALEVIFLRARLNRWIILGLVECIAGGIAIGVTGANSGGAGSNPLWGGTLALFGAVTVAVYMVIGRSVRSRLALLPYIYIVYGSAAIVLVVLVALSGSSFTGYSANAYLYMLLIAIFPQIIGHSSFNYAVKYLPATYIGIITQLEPIASAGLALALLAELPTPIQIVASALILFGVANVVLSPAPLSPAEAVEEADSL